MVEAQRLTLKLEVHDTPKHRGALTMVEIERAVLACQCVDQCLSSHRLVEHVIAPWVARLKSTRASGDWRL